MPCSISEGEKNYYREKQFNEEIQILKNSNRYLMKELNNLTRMLCSACEIIDEFCYSENFTDELKEWWDIHKKFDEENRKCE